MSNFTEKFDELGSLIDEVMLLDHKEENEWQRKSFKTIKYAMESLNKNNAFTYISVDILYITNVLKTISDEIKRAEIEIELDISKAAKVIALAEGATESQAIQARVDSEKAKIAVDNIINPPE